MTVFAGDFDIIELGHNLSPSSLHGPISPGFESRTTLAHAPFVPGPIGDDTVTSGIDEMTTGNHTGTHVDALAHVARGGRLGDGTDILAVLQSPGSSLPARVTTRPIFARGILLDFPRFWKVERVDPSTQFTADDLLDCAKAQGTELLAGDAVLIRTGWDTLVEDPDSFLSFPAPGPEQAAARLLAKLPASIVGSDTMPFEAAPGVVPLEVHAQLLADAGIQIMEMLNLLPLSERGIVEFLFVLAPLRISGGTGSPVNPLALIER